MKQETGASEEHINHTENNDCKHEFQCVVDVFVYRDRKPLASVEFRGACTKCKAHLEFIGMPFGLSESRPTVDPTQREVRLPAVVRVGEVRVLGRMN